MFWGRKRHFMTGKIQLAFQSINQTCDKNHKENRNFKFLDDKL